ncbi:hypothetical protein BD769DRAFT_1684020 [Suillus cothurnatus]|nr:hypothetical protein BD769DRAFT_1684020 [Suillus cothurnatus]
MSPYITYQDSVTAPPDCKHDDYAALLDKAENDADDQPTRDDFELLQQVLSAVAKLQKIVCSVHSSPQQQKAWHAEVTMSLKKANNATSQVALMLILDVKTRWSSMHQMLCRALDFCQAIDDFIAKPHDFRQYELSDADWARIELVTQWLKSFCSATAQVSTTKHPMLSSAHAIFHGL